MNTKNAANFGACLAFTALLVATAKAAPSIPRPDHVVIVIEENHAYEQIIGSSSAPYINSLANSGALFTQSFAIGHPSQPNYHELYSGSNQGLSDDSCPHTFTTANLGAEVLQAGLSFIGYSEGLPSQGSTTCTSGSYARKHCPWISWQNVSANFIPSTSNDPFTSFPSSTNFASLPTVSFVIPNLNDDMHDGTIPAGDTWLKNHLDAYAQWAKTHNSLLIVTWDEDDDNHSNHIPTIAVGQMVVPGHYGESVTHYNFLRTVEDMYGLPHAGNAASATPITDCWTTSTQQAATPTFNPVGGTYSTAQSVTISTTTSGASIRYTTDGSTPSETAGTLYSGPVNISSTTALKAIAYKTGFTDSTVASATYTISTGGGPITLEVESLSPVGTGATVSISNDANASAGVVEFLNSTAAGQTMTLTTPNLAAGTYQVQLRYKTNTSRGQHTVKIDGSQVGGTVDQYATTSAYASVNLGNATLATSGAHTIVLTVTGKNASATQFYITADTLTFTPINVQPQVATPSFSPAAGTYSTTQSVTISSTTSGAIIRYTTDSSTPSETAGTIYSGPVSISATTTLKAIAYETGFTDSAVTSGTYTITTPPPPQVAAPSFTPAAGTYSTTQSVAISTTTSGATLRYTTDGSTPSETAGTIYSGPVSISTTTTLKAIGYETGFTDSVVTSGTYTISVGPPPTVSFEAESLSPVGTGTTVSISNDANASGGVVEFLNSTAAGQTMTLTTPSITAGTYQVQMRYKPNTSRGQLTVKIDGTQVGGTLDEYSTSQTYVTATLGNTTLATGTHTIVLTVTGKNASATQFYLTADKFTFVGQ